MDEVSERAAFEDKIFRKYFIKSIRFVPGKQFAECNAVPPEELFKRDSSDDYADAHISAMWYGWRAAKGLI